MSKLPHHIQENMKLNKNYYSLYDTAVLDKCKVDETFLGDVLLVNENLIWHSVHKYIGKPDAIIVNNCIEKDDILQLGRLGFIKAIYAFDPTRNIKFSSFGVTAIVREIRCFLRDSGSIIRPTRTANELIYRINRIEREFGYLPSTASLAVTLDVSEDKITKAIQIGRSVVYLSEHEFSSDNVTNNNKVNNTGTHDSFEDEVVDMVYVDSLIDNIKDSLSTKEVSILRMRLSGLNQTQTADKQDVSQMRVNRLMHKVAKLLADRNLVVSG